ncbi:MULTISPECIES: 4-hydroxy-tetrahydrodipicolinate synthase [unclassified Jeotgalicoccus]|jgi:4-hydroxy-tetrahydrodipicolinate synthase|uniref:4-hydroxy-tetrahydrodipicolinate synthase n=1 Tax=unclassified Jeotgalicoccus TaxID=2630462 RepID=UPI00141514D8|nr:MULTISPECIES: 4-hydroxy-tetrahydrodipicolinate synthase [unclassified Jeotgalicoccus]QQD85360.1 4-hydroxy-tetrahydrodipicolinate synthase [Jeotgalicoccus sp. ATCC 8456]
MTHIFEGIGVAMTTPFSNNQVDYEAYKNHIEFLIEHNAQSLIINGTTGESPTLSDDEIKGLLNTAIETVNGRVPVIAGTGTNSTERSMALSKYAEEAGADAVMLITPYYNKSNQRGLVAHFTTIADAINIPIVLYNVPSRTNLSIEPETVLELSQHRNIVALKDAVGDLNYTINVLNLVDENFALYSGNDDNFTDFTDLGGKGLISVVGNVIPKELQDVYERQTNNDRETARARFKDLMPVINAVQVDVNPIPVKALTAELGFGQYELRLPLLPLDEAVRQTVVDVYQSYKEGVRV